MDVCQGFEAIVGDLGEMVGGDNEANNVRWSSVRALKQSVPVFPTNGEQTNWQEKFGREMNQKKWEEEYNCLKHDFQEDEAVKYQMKHTLTSRILEMYA